MKSYYNVYNGRNSLTLKQLKTTYRYWNGLGQVFLLIFKLAAKSSSEVPHLEISVPANTEYRCPKFTFLWKLSTLSSRWRMSILDPSSKLDDFVLSKLRPLLYSQVKLSMLSSLLLLVLGLFLNRVLSDLLSQLFRMLRPGNSKLPLFPLKATCLISLSFGKDTLFCFDTSIGLSLFSWFSVALSLSWPGWKSGSKVWNLMSTGVECAVELDWGAHWSVSRIETRSSYDAKKRKCIIYVFRKENMRFKMVDSNFSSSSSPKNNKCLQDLGTHKATPFSYWLFLMGRKKYIFVSL